MGIDQGRQPEKGKLAGVRLGMSTHLNDYSFVGADDCDVRARSPNLWCLLRVPSEGEHVVAWWNLWHFNLVNDAPLEYLSGGFVNSAVVLVVLSKDVAVFRVHMLVATEARPNPKSAKKLSRSGQVFSDGRKLEVGSRNWRILAWDRRNKAAPIEGATCWCLTSRNWIASPCRSSWKGSCADALGRNGSSVLAVALLIEYLLWRIVQWSRPVPTLCGIRGHRSRSTIVLIRTVLDEGFITDKLHWCFLEALFSLSGVFRAQSVLIAPTMIRNNGPCYVDGVADLPRARLDAFQRWKL